MLVVLLQCFKMLKIPQIPNEIASICSNARPHLKRQKTCRHNWHLPTQRELAVGRLKLAAPVLSNRWTRLSGYSARAGPP